MQISAREEFLFWGWKTKDKEAFDQILSLYARSLYAFLCGITGGQESEISSLLVETFSKILRTPPDPRRPFLVRALHHIANRYGKKGSPEASHELLLREVDKWQVREQRVVLEALQRLAWEDRMLILLRDQQELLIDEIQAVLGWPEEQIKKELREARIRFRAKVNEVMREKRKVRR